MRDYFKSEMVLRGKEDTSATEEKRLAEVIIYLLAEIKLKFNGLVKFSYKEKRETKCSQVNLHGFGVPFELWSVTEVFAKYICAKSV